MRRRTTVVLGLGLAAMIVLGPWAYASFRERHLRNFRPVRHGMLYRSGQLSLPGLKQVLREHGIRTVITLRGSDVVDKLPPDWAEEEYCRKEHIHYLRLPPRHWWDFDDAGRIPADENVQAFLKTIDNPDMHPILVHCFAGAHRTGAYCAIFRMEYDRWDNAAALEELHRCGYENLYREKDVLGYLSDYVPRWKRRAPTPTLPAPAFQTHQ